jgi:UDP-N-acetylglucosamine--N-acetylmuramyl-(pentapeptide) pyrophosphoryl-undecaprenol N-acetylglucosamine transferase
VIFVPFPFAAEDHQTVNARRLVDKGAALMVTDEEVRSRLMPMIVELSNDESRRQQLTQNISRLAVRNADETIAREIINNLNA